MLPTEMHSSWPERYCPRSEYTVTLCHSLVMHSFSSRHKPAFLLLLSCSCISQQPITSASCLSFCLRLPPPPSRFPSMYLSFLSSLSRLLSFCISFTPLQIPTVGRARVAVQWRNGLQIAQQAHKQTDDEAGVDGGTVSSLE